MSALSASESLSRVLSTTSKISLVFRDQKQNSRKKNGPTFDFVVVVIVQEETKNGHDAITVGGGRHRRRGSRIHREQQQRGGVQFGGGVAELVAAAPHAGDFGLQQEEQGEFVRYRQYRDTVQRRSRHQGREVAVQRNTNTKVSGIRGRRL